MSSKHLFAPFGIALLLVPFFADAGTRPLWTRTLSLGSRGQDVVELQNTLIGQGDLSAGNNTGYFGRLTEAAVKKFQCRTNIVCSGSSSATGYGTMGPRTRAKLLEGFSSGSAASSNFIAYPMSGSSRLTVSFTASIVRGMVDDGQTYSIDFGDGNQAWLDKFEDSAQAMHTYSEGTYTARLIHTINPCVKVINCYSSITTETLGTAMITVTAGSPSSPSDQLEQVYSEIKATIGINASDISQCRSIAIGHKLCGGPGGYLVYSIQSTNESKLKDIVTRFTTLQKEYQSKYQSGLDSTCDVTPEPTIEFKSGMCAAAPLFPLMAP